MTPNAVVQTYTDAYISTFDWHKPEINKILMRKYGDQGLGFFNTLSALGYDTPVSQTEYSHYEEDWIHTEIGVHTGVVNPGAGNPITFRLRAQDLDASDRRYVEVGDDVMLLKNQVTGTVSLVTVVGAGNVTVTVQPHQSTDNFGALLQGDIWAIYSNNYAEGTGQPNGKVSKVNKYTFNTKIVKETHEYTGSEATNVTWLETMSDGKVIRNIVGKGQLDADYRMSLRIDGALLFDKPTTTTALTNAGNRTTYGLVPWVRSGGNVDTYATGFYSIADFDYQTNILDQSFAPTEMIAFLGLPFQQEWENLFVNSFTEGAIVYANFQEPKKAVDLNIGFKSFTKTERTWHIKRMGIFNHPKIYGATGSKIPNMGVLVPMDTRKDAQTGGTIPSIGRRYKALGDYNRKMKVWPTGGAKANTNQIDKDELNMRSEFGSEYTASNRFFLIEAQ